jgi:hypothetical protein
MTPGQGVMLTIVQLLQPPLLASVAISVQASGSFGLGVFGCECRHGDAQDQNNTHGAPLSLSLGLER